MCERTKLLAPSQPITQEAVKRRCLPRVLRVSTSTCRSDSISCTASWPRSSRILSSRATRSAITRSRSGWWNMFTLGQPDGPVPDQSKRISVCP